MKQSDAIRNRAYEILTSESVLTHVKSKRKSFIQARKSQQFELLDDYLRSSLESLEKDVLLRGFALDKKRFPNIDLWRLARGVLGRFVYAAEHTRSPYKRLAKQHAEQLADCFTATKYRFRAVVPLVNFDAVRSFRLAGVYDGKPYRCRIRKKDYALQHAASYGFHAESYEHWPYYALMSQSNSQWVAIVDVDHPSTKDQFHSAYSPTAASLARCLVRSIRLCCPGRIYSPVCYNSRDSFFAFGMTSFPCAPGVEDPFEECTLSDTGIADVRRFWKKFGLTLLKTPLPPQLAIATEYFDSSYTKDDLGRYLDLCIACEALIGVQSEQTYRIPLRAAALLGFGKADTLELFDQVKVFWTIRNAIAHGSSQLSKTGFRGKVRKNTPELEAFTRKLIVYHLRLMKRLGRGYHKQLQHDFERDRIVARLNH